MGERADEGRASNPLGLIVTLSGVALQMLGLSGIADGLVEWRGFFERGVMQNYGELVERVAGAPLSPAWSLSVGYATSCIGFFVAAFQTMREHQRYLSGFTLPRDYESVEHAVPYSEQGLDRVEAWAHRRARGAVLRLAWLSLVWPLFLLWAAYAWTFLPRRKVAVEMTEAERNAVRMSGFDYGKASRAEALAFVKWSLLAILGFVAILFVFSDVLGG